MTRRALTLVILLAGCAEDDKPADRLSVVSFNAGLAFGYVAEASARVDPIIGALSELDADVVCLQELWVEQTPEGAWESPTIERILAETSGTFEHSYWSRTTAPADSSPVGCSVEEAEPLEACATANCGDVPPENLADCVLADCVDEFMGTSTGCQSCMAANLGQPLDAIIGACKGVTQSGIVFDGHNGLALLSRLPLTQTEIRELDYALTARSVLRGAVELGSGATADVLCTHIAADLSGSIDYPEDGSFTSFPEENRAQTDAVLGFAAELEGPVFLAGDFNHGPAENGGRAEIPESYTAVLGAGFTDPVIDTGRSCTFCDSNTLIDATGDSGKIIDHVYVPDGVNVEAAAVVLDATVDVTGTAGDPITTHLSDHFGVRVDVSF